jgi:hypothetical protein
MEARRWAAREDWGDCGAAAAGGCVGAWGRSGVGEDGCIVDDDAGDGGSGGAVSCGIPAKPAPKPGLEVVLRR